jgi:RNA-binding protein Musashi
MLLVAENLQRYFSRYGEVIDCVVMKNSESGRSRGFGFVTFSDPANVSLVLQNGPHQLDGRTVKDRFFGSHVDMISILFKKFRGDLRE